MAPPIVTLDRPLRADAQRNRQSVLDAAKTAFTELGLDARMEDIARRAGVGVGTVYRHFPTKEALIGELLSEKWRALRRNAEESLATEPDAWEAFAGALRRNAEIMSADAGVRDALMHMDSPKVWQLSEPSRQELIEATRELIARGQAAGVLRDDLTVDDIPTVMCGVCATMDAGGPAGQHDWRRHLELVLDGMRNR